MREAIVTIDIWAVQLAEDFFAIQGVSEGEAWKVFLHHTGGTGSAKLLRGSKVMSSLHPDSVVRSSRRKF